MYRYLQPIGTSPTACRRTGSGESWHRTPQPGLGLYDMQTGQEIARIKLAEWGHIVGFSPDSQTFLVGGALFIIYNGENGEPIRSLRVIDDVSFWHDWDK